MLESEKSADSTQVRTTSASDKKIPERYRASIVILRGHAEGMEYPLTKTSTVIGRDKSADVVLKDPLVSRQHAAVLYSDGEFSLKDLGSTNGTILKGKPVTQAEIKSRDRFHIGDTVIQFILEDIEGSKIFEIK